MSSHNNAAQSILLVDDNDEVRLSVAMTLELENFTVHTAEHGREALELLRSVTPDLILSDVNMPEMDGVELYLELKKDPLLAQIPIIFITASEIPPDLQSEGKESGEEFLLKPFDAGLLLNLIDQYICPA
jgi:CheY-like chemotaxis protein